MKGTWTVAMRILMDHGSANGAEYESQGQARSEAKRVAPGDRINKKPLALKGRNTVVLFRPFRPRRFALFATRGDALRFASRLPLAFIFRAVGAPPQNIMYYQLCGLR